MTRVKICGVTTEGDADAIVGLGVELIGINLVASSARCVSFEQARRLVAAVRGRAEVVLVVADRDPGELGSLKRELGADALQLHGDEPPEVLAQLDAADYKALRIATARDVARAAAYGGQRLLVDAKVPGLLGGSGRVFDWELVRELARERCLLLAGGLTPNNVLGALESVDPWAVDTASGVELRPGVKDLQRVERFVARVRAGLA